MDTTLLILVSLVFFPLTAFFYAVLPERRAVKSRNDFLYSGLTFGRTVTSTVGSLFTVGFFWTAIIGAASLYGSYPLDGLLFGTLVVYPALLYLGVRATSVRQHYANISLRKATSTSFGYFLASNYGKHAQTIIVLMLCFLYAGILLSEVAYILVWFDFLLSPYFSFPWMPAFFLLLVCFLYVYVGGYEQVLRTDFLQFIGIAALFLVVFFELSWFFIDSLGWENYGAAMVALFSTGTDTLMAKYGAQSGLRLDERIQSATQTQMSTYSALGALIFVGVYMLSSSDIWIRLTRSIYVDKNFAETAGKKRNRRYILFFSIVSLSMFALFLLPGALGVFGYINVELVEAFHSDTYAGRKLDDTERQFGILHYISVGFSQLQAADFGKSSIFFGDFSAFTLVVVMAALSLAIMTTLDTALITVCQLLQDKTHLAGNDRNGANGDDPKRPRRIALTWYLAVIVSTFSAYFLFRNQFVLLAQYIGILTIVLSTTTLFIIFVRIFAPSWFQNADIPPLLTYITAFILSIAVWLVLWQMRDYIRVPGLPFEKDIGFNFGQILVVTLLVHAIVFLVSTLPIVQKHLKSLDRSANGS